MTNLLEMPRADKKWRYKWISRKLKGKQHLCHPDGRTICKAENGSSRFDTISDTPDPVRSLCGICTFLVGKKKPKRRNKRKAKPSAALPKGKSFYKSAERARLRYDALKASKGCCELCGRSSNDGAILQVDHIKPVSTHWDLRNNPDNLQVLCSLCNWGKGAQDDTDWREPDVRTLMGERLS